MTCPFCTKPIPENVLPLSPMPPQLPTERAIELANREFWRVIHQELHLEPTEPIVPLIAQKHFESMQRTMVELALQEQKRRHLEPGLIETELRRKR